MSLILDFGGIKYNKIYKNIYIYIYIYTLTIKIMRNQFAEYKTLLQTFSFQDQIDEINDMIKKLANKKHIENIRDSRYERIKELKHMRDNLKIKICA